MNCSGKHSGMLVTCTVNGFATDAELPLPGAPAATTDHIDHR